jgi:hypothetical protein
LDAASWFICSVQNTGRWAADRTTADGDATGGEAMVDGLGLIFMVQAKSRLAIPQMVMALTKVCLLIMTSAGNGKLPRT